MGNLEMGSKDAATNISNALAIIWKCQPDSSGKHCKNSLKRISGLIIKQAATP